MRGTQKAKCIGQIARSATSSLSEIICYKGEVEHMNFIRHNLFRKGTGEIHDVIVGERAGNDEHEKDYNTLATRCSFR